MNGNVEEAEDAFSQITLKAWDQLFIHADRVTHLQAWLMRFTYNVCMDIHRANKRKAIAVETIEEFSETNVAVDPLELSLLSDELEIRIRLAISTLPIRLSLSFLMRFEEEMSYADIAKKLDISKDNAYKRISQARVILKTQISAYLSGEQDFASLEISLRSIKDEKPMETILKPALSASFSLKVLTECLYCQSIHIRKNGKRKGKQNYHCKKCDRQFINSYSGRGYSSEIKERCLNLYFEGMDYRAIERKTGVSHNTVINWVKQRHG
jgi:RNA polymerase sigma-70 factor (ECF subfamily)